VAPSKETALPITLAEGKPNRETARSLQLPSPWERLVPSVGEGSSRLGLSHPVEFIPSYRVILSVGADAVRCHPATLGGKHAPSM